MQNSPTPSSDAVLKAAGIRPTWPRIAILDVLQSRKDALSAADIFQYLRDEGHALPLGTVYATLRQLLAGGIIACHHDFGRSALYSRHTEQSISCLQCQECGRVLPIEDARIRVLLGTICQEQGMKLQDFQLRMAVSCADCQRPAKPSPRPAQAAGTRGAASLRRLVPA